MKGLFWVFAAIIACAVADENVLDHICSVSGAGKATITTLGTGIPFKMIRVKDTARYDFYEGDKVIGSILMRPDADYGYGLAFYYLPILPTVCYQNYNCLMLSRYSWEKKTKEGYDVYYSNIYSSSRVPYAEMHLNGDTLVKEIFRINDDDFFPVEIAMVYDTVDNGYVHSEVDDAFSLSNDNCSRAESNATRARSSLDCYFGTIPDYMCSVSASGTAVLSLDQNLDMTVDVKMSRVKDTARFDFSVSNTPYGSLLLRSDTHDAFLQIPTQCIELSYYLYPPSNFFEVTEDGFDLFADSYNSAWKLYVNHSTQELEKESIDTGAISLSIIYDSVDHDWENENDTTFTLSGDSCPDGAKTPNKRAKTSIQCTEPKVVKPVIPGCSFNFFLRFKDADYFFYYWGLYGFDMSVMMKDGAPYLIAQKYSNCSTFVRCDIKDENGECLLIYRVKDFGSYTSEYCSDDDYVRLDDLEGDLFPFKDFEYNGEPEDVSCPDKSTGCKQYCNDLNGWLKCIVVNKDGYIVEVDDEFIVEYKDSVPSLKDFEATFCNDTEIQNPESPCGPTSSSTSTLSGSNESSALVSSSSFTLPSIVLVAVAFVLTLW